MSLAPRSQLWISIQIADGAAAESEAAEPSRTGLAMIGVRALAPADLLARLGRRPQEARSTSRAVAPPIHTPTPPCMVHHHS